MDQIACLPLGVYDAQGSTRDLLDPELDSNCDVVRRSLLIWRVASGLNDRDLRFQIFSFQLPIRSPLRPDTPSVELMGAAQDPSIPT